MKDDKIDETIKMSQSPSEDGDKETLYVIKIGGHVIDDETKLKEFLKSFADIKVPRQPAGGGAAKKILVHGGGKLATKMAEQLGIEQQLIDGRRITDAETLKIVTMVYAGYINKNIVAKLQGFNCNAVGICGADGDVILAHKRKHPVLDYGFVGDVDAINIDLINDLLEKNIAFVIAPITHNGQGQLLNTNADTIAQELAKGLSKDFEVTLIYLFEKAGVLMNADDDSSVINKINPASYKELKQKQIIFAGMIPKLDNAFTALNSGVSKVIIGKAENLQQVIEGSSGTTIVNE
jgi:acetylglutamate kinase